MTNEATIYENFQYKIWAGQMREVSGNCRVEGCPGHWIVNSMARLYSENERMQAEIDELKEARPDPGPCGRLEIWLKRKYHHLKSKLRSEHE